MLVDRTEFFTAVPLRVMGDAQLARLDGSFAVEENTRVGTGQLLRDRLQCRPCAELAVVRGAQTPRHSSPRAPIERAGSETRHVRRTLEELHVRQVVHAPKFTTFDRGAR